MSLAFLYQLFASAVAVAVLVGLAAWIGIPHAWGPMTADLARRILAEEFPEAPIERVVVSPDGKSAIAVSGDQALIVRCVGDGHAVHAMPLKDLTIRKRVKDGVLLNGEAGASPIRFALRDGESWPPPGLSA